MVTVLLFLLTFYVVLLLFFRLLNWADTEPVEAQPVPGLCGCRVDPYAGVAGHCRHKTYQTQYVPRHAFN